MTIDALIIQCCKTVVFFKNHSILPSSCLCTNIYYVRVVTGSCPLIIDNILGIVRSRTKATEFSF